MNGYLAKASEALASARLLLEAGQLTGAANRAYYAFFHAAQATMAEVGGANPRTIKTHRGLWTQFNLNVVSAGLIDKEVAAYVSSIESTRIAADYGDEPVQRDEIEAAIQRAQDFVDACAKILRRSTS